MTLSIGLQLYSVREAMAKDFVGTLKKVKEYGYEGVEFAGLFGKEGKEVKAILDDLSLKSISSHVPLSALIDDVDKTLQTYKDFGTQYIVIPHSSVNKSAESGELDKTLELFESLCEKVKEYGMKMLYHNHDFEFELYNGEYILDIIYKTIPKDLLETQIDTCWANVGGEDPSKYVKKYTGRAPIVHLKDFVMKGRKKGEKLYDLIGIDDSAKKEKKGKENFAFRPLGYGVQDIQSILNASKEAGASWVIVEQDSPAEGQSEMESAKLSIDYLKKLNF